MDPNLIQPGQLPNTPQQPIGQPMPGPQQQSAHQPAGQPVLHPTYGAQHPQPTPQAQPPQNPGQPPQNQLLNPGTQGSSNPYDFIVNPSLTPKKQPLLGGSSLRGKLLVIGGGGMILIIIVIVLSSFLNAASSKNVKTLRNLVAEQQEIVRVATLGIASATDTPARNLSQSAQLTVFSDEIELKGYLTGKKVKITAAELKLKQDTKTDAALEAAKQSNTYDSVLTAKLLDMLNSYAGDLSDAYKSASNTTSKGILKSSFESNATLVKGYSPAQSSATPSP